MIIAQHQLGQAIKANPGMNTMEKSDKVRTRRVHSQDVSLFVKEAGDPARSGLLFLHGFPDDHEVWSYQFEKLSKLFHVICFDLRGVGRSTCSETKDGYQIDNLLRDIEAVITATRGKKGKVHLVGHDWGSVLGWSFVMDKTLSHRVKTWVSISGPPLGIVWSKAKRDFLSLSPRRIALAASQMVHSWYIYTMFIPGLWERLVIPTSSLWANPLIYGTATTESVYLQKPTRKSMAAKMENAIELYRTNIFKPPTRPQKGDCEIPTALIIATKDKFIRPSLLDNLEEYATSIKRIRIDAGHWVQLEQPQMVTDAIRSFVAANES